TIIEQGGEPPDDLRGDYDREELVRWARTDEDGRYEVRLGPGRYKVRGPDPCEPEELELEAGEVGHDFHLPGASRGPITGEVRAAGEGGKPVVRAFVTSASVVPGHACFETETDEQGRFSAERWRDSVLVYARSPKGALAGLVEVAEQD